MLFENRIDREKNQSNMCFETATAYFSTMHHFCV